MREDERGKQSCRGNLIILLQLLLEMLVMYNRKEKKTEPKTKLSQNRIGVPLCLVWQCLVSVFQCSEF